MIKECLVKGLEHVSMLSSLDHEVIFRTEANLSDIMTVYGYTVTTL